MTVIKLDDALKSKWNDDDARNCGEWAATRPEPVKLHLIQTWGHYRGFMEGLKAGAAALVLVLAMGGTADAGFGSGPAQPAVAPIPAPKPQIGEPLLYSKPLNCPRPWIDGNGEWYCGEVDGHGDGSPGTDGGEPSDNGPGEPGDGCPGGID